MKHIKIEWCMNFIKKTFKKKKCKGIEVGCFWEMAEKSGLWKPEIYGSPMSKALDILTRTETISDENGNYLFSVFRLV